MSRMPTPLELAAEEICKYEHMCVPLCDKVGCAYVLGALKLLEERQKLIRAEYKLDLLRVAAETLKKGFEL